jgi:hypothetical protein
VAVHQAIRTTAALLPLPPLDDEHEGGSELQPLLLGKSSKIWGASGAAAAAGGAGGTESQTKRTDRSCDVGGGGNRPQTTTKGRRRFVCSAFSFAFASASFLPDMFYIAL